ncbi:DUF2624 family protein [Paenalkalicoccus suaedae]|uniref:DUF2624 family protein n=1 Tax=Paenalkalicoccus suaedae TaxID=2592382 RepID=A0A859FDR7_9BACI|nr:DUF2624 family protein [Paenalkalicoccus suaedae]QKS70882.1 DUF2624 family protein [Paenalkalicoccus suaedae]
MFEQLINERIRALNVREIMMLGYKYDVSLTVRDAKRIMEIIEPATFDIHDKVTLQKKVALLKEEFPLASKQLFTLLEPYL